MIIDFVLVIFPFLFLSLTFKAYLSKIKEKKKKKAMLRSTKDVSNVRSSQNDLKNYF